MCHAHLLILRKSMQSLKKKLLHDKFACYILGIVFTIETGDCPPYSLAYTCSNFHPESCDFKCRSTHLRWHMFKGCITKQQMSCHKPLPPDKLKFLASYRKKTEGDKAEPRQWHNFQPNKNLLPKGMIFSHAIWAFQKPSWEKIVAPDCHTRVINVWQENSHTRPISTARNTHSYPWSSSWNYQKSTVCMLFSVVASDDEAVQGNGK